MTDPADMIVPRLGDMRTDNPRRHEQTPALISVLEKRLGGRRGCADGLSTGADRRALWSKRVTQEFEKPVELLENRVRELEGQK